jgi:hypothetical protein
MFRAGSARPDVDLDALGSQWRPARRSWTKQAKTSGLAAGLSPAAVFRLELEALRLGNTASGRAERRQYPASMLHIAHTRFAMVEG